MKKFISILFCMLLIATFIPKVQAANNSDAMRSAKKAYLPYSQVGKFSEGLAWAGGNSTYHDRFGFMDTKGKLVIKAKYDEVSSFKEGLAAVRIGEKWGLIDTKGKVIIKPQYNEVYNFSEGLAPVN